MDEEIKNTEEIKEDTEAPGTAQTEAAQDESAQAEMHTPENDPEHVYGPVKKKEHKAENGFGKGLLVGIISTTVVFLIVGVVAAGFVVRSIPEMRKIKTSDIVATNSNSVSLDMEHVESKIEKIQAMLNEYYLFDKDSEAVENGIYEGMVAALGDPYTEYYTIEEYDTVVSNNESKYSGIGAGLVQDKNTKRLFVTKVYRNSPAEKAGLEYGDELIEVDGEDVSGYELDDLVSNHIRGIAGTDVELTILRGDPEVRKTIKITREEIEYRMVDSVMLDDNIGYIQVAQFTKVTANQYKEEIEYLLSEGAESLIIDMRDNPGGLVTSSIQMLDYTLPDGLLTYTADKDGKGNRYYSSDGHELDIPMVVLVNGNSASAAEIFTGAMKDFHAATIVGTTTYGKGIVQLVMNMGDGSGIKITNSHYYTPDGTDIHGTGIEPDEVVELPDTCRAYCDENDEQFKKALEVLKSETGKDAAEAEETVDTEKAADADEE